MVRLLALLHLSANFILASSDFDRFQFESECNNDQFMDTLLLGGDTTSEWYSNSIELITSDTTCTPDMPQLPVKRSFASAVVLGAKIYYCGGYYYGSDFSTCNSYLFNEKLWQEEESMIHARSYADMCIIGETIFVIGGYEDKVALASVESYTVEMGWKTEEYMVMPHGRYGHCSVTIRSQIVIIGGYEESSAHNSSFSSSVMSFDTINIFEGWQDLSSLTQARRFHACLTGEFESQQGIFVTGGFNGNSISSVEFYNWFSNTWQNLGNMQVARWFHTLSFVNNMIFAAGGYNGYSLSSVEHFQENHWESSTDLDMARNGHSSVSVPGGLISC